MDSARPESLKIIRELQTKIQPDDGCAIQFSSVRYLQFDSCSLCILTKSYIINKQHEYLCNKNEQDAIFYSQCKGKAIPLQASTGPEGSTRLRLPDFKAIDT